jgi:uncharacterized protein YcbX
VRVVSLHIYPVKGARAVDLARAQVTPIGLAGDRRWLIVDADARFVTQRTHPRLATITAIPTGDGLRLSADGMRDLLVPVPGGKDRLLVTIWDDSVDAARAGAEADAWLSAHMGEPLMLVHMDAAAKRMRDREWTPAPVPTSFADAYPINVITTASLAALNRAITAGGGTVLPMNRFRPNIVIDCGDAWAEDRWRTIAVGNTVLDIVKPSERCAVPTTDQFTGERMGNEPTATLSRIRMSGDRRINGVLFAWNAVPRTLGGIAVDDKVTVLEDRPDGFPLRTAV